MKSEAAYSKMLKICKTTSNPIPWRWLDDKTGMSMQEVGHCNFRERVAVPGDVFKYLGSYVCHFYDFHNKILVGQLK
jgi:hypothetical protein